MSADERAIGHELRRLGDLADADVNPKSHADVAIGASIGAFGFVEVPVLDVRTNKLVGGHGRRDSLVARKAAGEVPPPGVVVDGDGQWQVMTTLWRSKNDAEATAMGIALNRIGEAGGWNDEVLAKALTAADDYRGLTGYHDTEFVDLLARLAPPPSLDELAATHGDPVPSDLWPVIRLQVPPEVRDRFDALCARYELSPADTFARLCATE